jgi:predicted 3-demethylubiquinone-9 3-methyltransferase (glyoxalase superfamily)
MAKVKTCLWFKDDAEVAARRYVEFVPNSRIDRVQRGPGDWPGHKMGDVLVVDFTLGGHAYQALNGGIAAEYGTCASISVECEGQAEVDRLWNALLDDGGQAIQCGWLRDRFGVPWQIVPENLPRLIADADPAVARRVFDAMSNMVKLDVAAIDRAARGG